MTSKQPKAPLPRWFVRMMWAAVVMQSIVFVVSATGGRVSTMLVSGQAVAISIWMLAKPNGLSVASEHPQTPLPKWFMRTGWVACAVLSVVYVWSAKERHVPTMLVSGPAAMAAMWMLARRYRCER